MTEMIDNDPRCRGLKREDHLLFITFLQCIQFSYSTLSKPNKWPQRRAFVTFNTDAVLCFNSMEPQARIRDTSTLSLIYSSGHVLWPTMAKYTTLCSHGKCELR